LYHPAPSTPTPSSRDRTAINNYIYIMPAQRRGYREGFFFIFIRPYYIPTVGSCYHGRYSWLLYLNITPRETGDIVIYYYYLRTRVFADRTETGHYIRIQQRRCGGHAKILLARPGTETTHTTRSATVASVRWYLILSI